MTAKAPTVVVIAGTFVDIAIRCSQIPGAGQTVTGSAFSYTLTGSGPNQAIQAALCGCEVYLISKTGGDPFAQVARKILDQYKVSTKYLCTAPAKTTGAIVTIVNAEGENATCLCPGANTALTAGDIQQAESAIETADVCLIQGQLPKEAIIEAINLSKIHGAKVILDPIDHMSRMALDASDTCSLPIEYFNADIMIPNLYEAANIVEHSQANIRTAKMIGSELVARGVGTVVITMGKKGSMVIDRTSADHIPSFEIDLVDHTATGDAFAGALAAFLAVDSDIRKAVRFASAAGALACTKFGAIESLPAKAEIIELLQKEVSE